MKDRWIRSKIFLVTTCWAAIAFGAYPAHALLQVDPIILDEQYRPQASKGTLGPSSTHACTINPALIDESFIRAAQTERTLVYPGLGTCPTNNAWLLLWIPEILRDDWSAAPPVEPTPVLRASLQSFELTADTFRFEQQFRKRA